MRAQFVFSEIGIGLRRNLTMTIAVVLTVAISLSMLGVALLIREQVGRMKGFWYDKVEVSVYLCRAESKAPTCSGQISDEQRLQLNNDLRAMPQVQQVFYESKQDAYERFREQYQDSPDLVNNVEPDALNESYRVKLKDAKQFEVVRSAFADRPGVEVIEDNQPILKRFFGFLEKLQAIALFTALGALIAAALLISNTIRVAAFSRRRETGIMRLVGASNMYIQLPFLLEGVFAGLLGAGLASGALAFLKSLVITEEVRRNAGLMPYIGWDEVFRIIPLLLLAGVVLAGLSSLVTLRRHLRV